MAKRNLIKFLFFVLIPVLVIGVVSVGLYMRNRVDNEESEASFSFNPSIKVLTMYYYNSGTRPEITARNRDLISSLSDATKYKGYKSPNASRLINYISEGELNFDKPVPPSSQFFSSNGPFADHFNMLRNDINVCDYVDNRGVREIWIWMIHIPGQIVPNESNMSMGNSIRSKWNFSNYGDISNSYRSNDLPICNSTYTVYNYNMDRGLGTMIENHTHQIEHVLNFIDGRDVTPQNQWQNLLFWGKFVGSEANHKIINPGCGWTHYPPNGQSDYDWRNTTTVLSDCENWLPDGGGQKVVYNCLNLANGVCPNDEGVTFKIWWMQNIPGNNHNLFYSGKKLTNWWGFFSDFDYMMNNNLKLVEANPSNPLPNQAPVVNAGNDQTIITTSANLLGTVTDDDLPNPPASLTYTWSKASGPGTVTFSNINGLNTNATFSIGGVYVLRLTASDSMLSSNDDVVITVQMPQVSQPIFSPAGGTYPSMQMVTISTQTQGATIRYTIDGSDPTENSVEYPGLLYMTMTMTLKARAYKVGMTPSSVSSATYTIDSGSGITQVSSPEFNPPGGTYAGTQSVAISTATSGATIRYTTNGTNPTTTVGTIYSGPMTVSSTTTLKAIAYKSGMNDSNIATATYTVNTGGGGISNLVIYAKGTRAVRDITPTSVCQNGYPHMVVKYDDMEIGRRCLDATYPSSGYSYIINEENADASKVTIHFTNDFNISGVEDRNMIIERVVLNGVQTILPSALIYARGQWTPTYGCGTDIERPATYSNRLSCNGYMRLRQQSGGTTQVSNPSINPSTTTFTSSVSVGITTSTSGATIRYTTNGSDPTESSSLYTIPLIISSTTTIKAKAFKAGMTPSSVVSGTYTKSTTTSYCVPYNLNTTFDNRDGVANTLNRVKLTGNEIGWGYLQVNKNETISDFAPGITTGVASCWGRVVNMSNNTVACTSNKVYCTWASGRATLKGQDPLNSNHINGCRLPVGTYRTEIFLRNSSSAQLARCDSNNFTVNSN